MFIVTTNEVPGKKIVEYCGLCKGTTVHTKHVGKDILAGFRTIIGGEIKVYTELMDNARKVAIERLEEDAKKLGANAIVAMRLSTSAVMAGASEVIAYGTAVKVK